MVRLVLLGLCVWLAACSASQGDTASTTDSRTGSQMRHYDRESFTVVMTHRGVVTGTTTTYVRNWGRQQAVINDTVAAVGDTPWRTQNRIVSDGLHIITIEANGSITGTTISYDDRTLSERRGRSLMEYYEFVMNRSGARRTGEAGSFAGQACDYWEMPSVGARWCVTSWGLDLYRTNTMANVDEETATEVLIGDGGPDSAFAYDPSRVTEVSPWPTLPPAPKCEQRGSVLYCSETPR
ncbi:MAG: hypothetical protein HY054_03860 [Proteobacteria bacterium]|nr:hypothetical protein [Pseudomonadota bacterium]